MREDDGNMRAYVQAVEPNQVFRVGQRVRILTVSGTSRVALERAEHRPQLKPGRSLPFR